MTCFLLGAGKREGGYDYYFLSGRHRKSLSEQEGVAYPCRDDKERSLNYRNSLTDWQLCEFDFSSSAPCAQLSVVLVLWATRASFYLVMWRYINNEMELVIGLSR